MTARSVPPGLRPSRALRAEPSGADSVARASRLTMAAHRTSAGGRSDSLLDQYDDEFAIAPSGCGERSGTFVPDEMSNAEHGASSQPRNSLWHVFCSPLSRSLHQARHVVCDRSGATLRQTARAAASGGYPCVESSLQGRGAVYGGLHLPRHPAVRGSKANPLTCKNFRTVHADPWQRIQIRFFDTQTSKNTADGSGMNRKGTFRARSSLPGVAPRSRSPCFYPLTV